ncbi:MAG: 30S ribosomal protein S6 [Calditrichota bacterium]
MRTYELVLVFDPALEVEQIDQDLRKLNDMMTANGTPRRWERWGKRRLAYEIGSRQYGYYVLAVFDSDSLAVTDIDRSIRLNAAVIRHLITVVDPKRVPETDPESIRTLGAAPETAAQTSSADEETAAANEGGTESTLERAGSQEDPNETDLTE